MGFQRTRSYLNELTGFFILCDGQLSTDITKNQVYPGLPRRSFSEDGLILLVIGDVGAERAQLKLPLLVYFG